MKHPDQPHSTAARWWAINPSTLSLLAVILLVTASTELWSPLVPEHVKTLRKDAVAGGASAATILLIALYGFLRDLMEAVNYYAGGAIGGRLNTRRSLLLFNMLPLAGLTILLLWRSPAAVFVAMPLVFMWDSIAGPSIITVVGSSVPAERRTMAFSLQAIFRRVARWAAYWIAAAAVYLTNRETGFRAAVGLGVLMLLAAAAVQLCFMRTAQADSRAVLHSPRLAWDEVRRYDRQLKRLLLSDIFARWAEGLPRELIILFCLPLLSPDRDRAAALYMSVLLTVQALTNVALYLGIGPLASREGLAKKPFIGLTFLFFAAFPLALAGLGPALGLWGLVLAFVIGGCREIGEPARKAMISELVDPATRTQSTGLYWAARGAAVMPASLVGGLVWVGTDALWPGWGATATLCLAGAAGLAGALFFSRVFGRDR